MAPYGDAVKDRSAEFEWDLGKASRNSKSMRWTLLPMRGNNICARKASHRERAACTLEAGARSQT